MHARKPLILSADDDENAQLLLSRAFLKAGLAADIAAVYDGDGVIRYLGGSGDADFGKADAPGLLLLDLKMPQKDGFQVLEYLQSKPHLRTFPVVVFSSSADERDVTRAYQLGCHSYVVKPADFEKLVLLVKALITQFFDGAESHQPPPIEAFAVRCKESASRAPENAAAPAAKSGSVELYRLLVEQVKDYGIFLLDREGHVISWNEGARRIKGYESKEIIGKHFSVFYPQTDRESQKPQFELRKALEMGRYEEEGWRIRKDGSRFWANVVVTPLYNDQGLLVGYAKVTRDLTQRKLQEETFQDLLESEERFRLLVEQVKDYAIFILDARGHISSWNQGAKRLKGYSADEVLGKHFSLFYTPEDIARNHPTNELTIAIRDGRYEEEGWRIRKDGTRFWANVVITSLWDKRGNLTGFAKVTRDLTDRKRKEDALRQKTEELESFAHTLSHDLRAPLRSICSFAQILAEDINQLSDEERSSYAQKIFKASQTMDVLMMNILKLSELSLAPVEAEPVDLEEVLAECVQMIEADITSTNAAIEILPPLPRLCVNRTLLSQLFLNLISNAIKFSRPGEAPQVTVRASVSGDRYHIHVHDCGIGIPAHLHQSIFNLFERGHASPNVSGTGIGLAVAKKAAERMGGTIAVKSEPGVGSEFILSVPVSAVSPTFAAASPGAA